MVNQKMRVSCPGCGVWLAVGRSLRVPFVSVALLCDRCGATVTVVHPKYAQKNLGRMRTCLDCGQPLPRTMGRRTIEWAGRPVRTRIVRRRGPFHGLSRTCPSCWLAHQNDEPGDDLDAYIRIWYRRVPVDNSPPRNTMKGAHVANQPPRKESRNGHRTVIRPYPESQ